MISWEGALNSTPFLMSFGVVHQHNLNVFNAMLCSFICIAELCDNPQPTEGLGLGLGLEPQN